MFLQLAQLCSRIVFLIFGGTKNSNVSWKPYENSGFGMFCSNQEMAENWQDLKSKTGPIISQ